LFADAFDAYALKNRIGRHISLKYLGYEENLNKSVLESILEKLSTNSTWIDKTTRIRISEFGVMQGWNSCLEKTLYLKVEPAEYLKQVNKHLICLLEGETDIFIKNDYENYTPHIACGTINNAKLVENLNKLVHQANPIYIENWYVAIHTKGKEYIV
jgi:hypothetical protein